MKSTPIYVSYSKTDDPNLVLTLTAFDVLTGEALNLSHNDPHFFPPHSTPIYSRETTHFSNTPEDSRSPAFSWLSTTL